MSRQASAVGAAATRPCIHSTGMSRPKGSFSITPAIMAFRNRTGSRPNFGWVESDDLIQVTLDGLLNGLVVD
jgi:hypothetical protein